MDKNPSLRRAVLSVAQAVFTVVLGPGIPAGAVAASFVAWDQTPDLAKAALIFLDVWVIALALIVYVPKWWHHRRVEVDLIPSTGKGQDVRLHVRNKTSTRNHWAKGRIVATRNGASPRDGIYAVPWFNASGERVLIQHDDSEPLFIAQWTLNHDREPAGLINVLEIGPAPLAGSAHAVFDLWRWFHDDATLPEIDIEISVFAEGIKVPRVETFTLALATVTGPLNLTAKPAAP